MAEDLTQDPEYGAIYRRLLDQTGREEFSRNVAKSQVAALRRANNPRATREDLLSEQTMGVQNDNLIALTEANDFARRNQGYDLELRKQQQQDYRDGKISAEQLLAYPGMTTGGDPATSTPPAKKPEEIPQVATWAGGYNSYSGADIRATIVMPGSSNEAPIIKTLANLQTISYSIFREKYPVRALGCVGEKNRTRGSRTIAGSMVFTVFDRHVLFDVLKNHPNDLNTNGLTPVGYNDLAYTMIDQLPPFDILIHFANEYGYTSEMVIYGVDISAEGQVMSIEDLITENTVQYTAQHIAIMRPGGYIKAASEAVKAEKNKTFSSILNNPMSPEMVEVVRKTRNIYR